MADGSLRGKTVVLGLDGGTWHILRKYADRGVMPNLASALERWAIGDLESCTPPYSAPGWTTITTGLNPGRHGIFDFFEYKDGVQQPISAYSARGARIWQLASEAGKRVHVFNVPVSYPPYPVNGTFVSGLMTPGPASPFTHPAGLRETLTGMPGGYEPDPYAVDQMWSEFLDAAAFWITQKERALRQILATESWDLVFSVIQETDPLQHKFWFAMDEEDPRYDAARARKYGAGIEAIYALCDEAIGHRLEMANRGANLLLISDHGFGRYESYFYINKVLEAAGLLARTSKRRRAPVSPMKLVRAARALDVFGIESRLSVGVRKRLLTRLDDALSSSIDWPNTLAFAGSSSAECVFVKAGVANRESVCDRVVEALGEARDPETGAPMIRRAYRREEIYAGPEVDRLPDVVLDFGNEPYLGSDRLSGPSITEPLTPSSGGGRHRQTGIVLAAGPEISPCVIEGARIADVLPTVLHSLELDIPEGLDGRVIDAVAAGREVTYSAASVAPKAGVGTAQDVYSDDDKEAIEATLRNLGYIE